MAMAIDKYTCPFCGQKSIFVGVHDDEGNYRGRPGCEYESDPWSGLCYALHHDGWGDCILCTDSHDLPLGGCFFDTAEEAFQAIPTLTPLNEPLTLDELREMNGKAVWVVPANKFSEPGKWCVICTEGNDDYSWAFSPGVGYDSWKFKDYGDRWLAYRRPPDGG